MKGVAEVGIEMGEAGAAKVAAAAESGTMSGPLVAAAAERGAAERRRWDAAAAAARVAAAASSLLALGIMVSAEQRGSLSVFGLQLPLYSKWSFSDSLEYLVGISAAVAAHSLLQLLLSMRKLVKRVPVIPSRSHAWVLFAGDQVFAYAMMSAGSAAAGVTNLNRAGIRHTALPNFCKPLHQFCNRMVISITFAFLSCLFLAISAVLDVIWLSKF
ncbi:CASP-like protein 3A1 [Ananas comosus]|uniref:CASP-like protein n=1 Tax=Ananas comosus TaxID=4615 RepID=A0A6P5FR63_ANACO|nr:CASP-like protein 3A1 [Ananas comosus]